MPKLPVTGNGQWKVLLSMAVNRILLNIPFCVCVTTLRKKQWFMTIVPGEELVRMRDVSKLPILKDYKPSLVVRLPDEGRILKLIRPRRKIEYIKMAWNRSRVSKEIRGNKILQNLGIKVPKVSEYGFGFFPVRPHDFLGYCVMQDLESLGYENSRLLFLENRIKPECRKKFIRNVFSDVNIMQENRVVFSDLKFENIFCNEKGEAVWIDTGVSSFSLWRNKKFICKHNDAIDYFLLHHEQFLSESEVKQFKSLKL